MSENSNFVKVGGICFAHGPYIEQRCPESPGCEVAILQEGPVLEYVEMAKERVRQTNKVYTQAEMDVVQAQLEAQRVEITELREALVPFAAMDREGTCDLSEVACERGTASDLTIITS